ncbi:hypothetical protein GA0116948_110141 [Chitinophaga costaii]|uniref:Uncharacterized protein n=1 Tax=Chitinophaga costaii TaxID=1335309 RepID=A0A1C4EZL3_9BACT|nr:hypothetical protein [Chitinophaga costaii]SCC48923.1 hypothetical protein GA0116948_110141 [Chitinophaga costaii]
MKKMMAILIVFLIIVVEVRCGAIFMHTSLLVRCMVVALVLLVGRVQARRRAVYAPKINTNSNALPPQPALSWKNSFK